MYINTIRLLAFIVLFAIIIIVEIPFKKLFKDPTIQLYIAVLCIAILMLLDNISGFILTIGILIIYFRIYTDINIFLDQYYDKDKFIKFIDNYTYNNKKLNTIFN